MAVLGTLAAAFLASAAAADERAPFLQTNEAEIARLGLSPVLSIDDPVSVFGAVFDALGDEVRVWPTENYYFFRFFHGARVFDGNLRLDAADRDSGIIHFAYFPRLNPDGDPGEIRHSAFGREDGVKVTRADRFTYVVVRDRKAVVFHLNRMADTRLHEGWIGAGEELIGPVFDETGVSFFLLWNSDLKVFLYVLNEDLTGDRFEPATFSDQLALGARTGFAVYADRYLKRRLLVGVRKADARRNTLLDGPFDQMPDNFIDSDILRDALIAWRPDLAGRIDRRGNFADLAGRVIIVPYHEYEDAAELALFDRCAAAAATRDAYYRCFDRSVAGSGDRAAGPVAGQTRGMTR